MSTDKRDVVERLHDLIPYVGTGAGDLLRESASEIERLRRSPSPDAGVGELESLRRENADLKEMMRGVAKQLNAMASPTRNPQ